MVTAGSDSMVRIWDLRTYQKLQHHQVASPIECLDLSQQNILALGSKKTVELFKDPFRAEIDKPYLDNRLNGSFVRDLRFCPYEDVLGVGHDKGYQSMLVPGAGIANYDTLEADPYATKFNRNEAEVKSLLEKIPADLISIDPDKLGEVVNETPWRNKEFKHPGLINIKRKNKPVSSEQVKIMDRESVCFVFTFALGLILLLETPPKRREGNKRQGVCGRTSREEENWYNFRQICSKTNINQINYYNKINCAKILFTVVMHTYHVQVTIGLHNQWLSVGASIFPRY